MKIRKGEKCSYKMRKIKKVQNDFNDLYYLLQKKFLLIICKRVNTYYF